MMKCVMFFVLAVAASSVSAGIVPVASYAVAPVASSYSSSIVNHAVAAPFVAAAPLVAAHAPVVAASAPIVAAPAHFGAYSAYPYSAYPYSAYPYATYVR